MSGFLDSRQCSD